MVGQHQPAFLCTSDNLSGEWTCHIRRICNLSGQSPQLDLANALKFSL
jgi:hypothetical protein